MRRAVTTLARSAIGRTLSATIALVVVLVFARPAAACAVCGAADKTLVPRGEELPFAGRFRATLDGRAASFAARYTPLRLVEMRLVPSVGVGIGESVILSAELPLLRRSRIEAGAVDRPRVETDRFSLGDAEVDVAYVAYRSATRRLALHGGAKAPTAPVERDSSGRATPTDLQPGCGAIVPTIGATYTVTGSLVSFWTRASFLMPVSVREGPHPGDSLRLSATAQLQPALAFATRLSVHGRLDAAGDVGGQVDPRSGGASVFVAPELVLGPITDLVVSVGAAFPLVQETRGHRATLPILLAGIGWDF